MSSNSLGKQGEQLFKQRMEQLGYALTDVSGNPEYWSKDIDFLATSPRTGLTKSFEIKFDSRINQTGNLYLELTNVHSKGGRGWFNFCEADYLAYGDAAAQVFYIIPLAQLKDRINAMQHQRYAQCGTDSTGLLVSLKDIQDIISVL